MVAKPGIYPILMVTVACILNCCHGNQNPGQTNVEQPADDALFTKILQTMIVVNAKIGRYEDAGKQLKLLEDYKNEIKPMVSLIYSGNATENNEHLANFLTNENMDCHTLANGVQAWFENMQKDNSSSGPEVVLLAYTVMKSGCVADENFNELRVAIEPFADQILEQWKDEIRNGSGLTIQEFMKSSPNKANAVRTQIPGMIKDIMSGNLTKHLNSVLTFAYNFPHFNVDILTFLQVVRELKGIGKGHSEEMLLTSYWIHQRMTNNPKRVTETQNLAESYTRLKNSIPETIQHIFWKSRICAIKNLGKDEYLVGRENKLENSGEAHTIEYRMFVPGWVLMPQMVNNQLVFVVMSDRPSRHRNLCKGENLEVKTCKGEPTPDGPIHDKWIFTPMQYNNTENAFFIRNFDSTGEPFNYMQATDSFKPVDSDGRSLRRVSTSDVTLGGDLHWKIHCF